jgi:hypothetical protein
MRTVLIALVVFPLAAAAQGGGAGEGAGRGQGQIDRREPGRDGAGPHGRGHDPERLARRMRVARTLGLAEALDLEPAEAVKLSEQLQANDGKRSKIQEQLQGSLKTLRRAATGDKVTAAEVDQAIQRMLTARGQLEALDREAVQAVVKDLSPERRARAVLFLERFRHFGDHREVRIRSRMMDLGGAGMGSHGMGPGMGGDMDWETED